MMNGDGSGAKLLIPASALTGGQHDLSAVRWSPDGTMIAFNCGSPTRSDASHICVMNADGTGIRHLSDESDAWFETDFAWSPDSTRIAFGRWYTDPATGTTTVRPIGWRRSQAVPSKTPVLRRPPKGRSSIGRPTEPPFCHSRLELLHSPSGAAPVRPLGIDVATGNAREVEWKVGGEASWQRVAD